jgi:hypothetical protein
MPCHVCHTDVFVSWPGGWNVVQAAPPAKQKQLLVDPIKKTRENPSTGDLVVKSPHLIGAKFRQDVPMIFPVNPVQA